MAVFCQKDGATLVAPQTADPLVGQTLLGQFRIDAPIGSGGMGTVYRAHQASLGRDVAVKILHPELAKNPDAVRRFHREAKVATSLEHPNLVRVLLFGELPNQDGLYLVMEYLDGQSLTDLLRREGAISTQRAMHIAAQMCSAIGVAHSQGIVHRDVKPENVMIVSKHGDPDFVKVLDFGIARVLWGEQQSAMTQSGVIFGTARYISPEGASGEATDARSDVYSIGVVVYQLLTGRTPFDATSPVAMLMKHIHDKPPHLRSLGAGPNVPPPIAEVVMRALSKKPDARFSNAADLGLALEAAAHQCGIVLASGGWARRSAASGPLVPIRSEVSPTPTTAPVHYAPRPEPSMQLGTTSVAGLSRKPPWMVLGAAFALGAVAVVGGAWAHQSMQEAEQAERLEELAARARTALRNEHYNAPPGDNVLELTQELMKEDPASDVAEHLRHDAVLRLRSEAMLAEAAGRHRDALQAYEMLLVFEPNDTQATTAAEGLRVVIARPPRDPAGIQLAPRQPSVGEPVELSALLDENAEAPERSRFEVFRGGRRIRSLPASEGSEPLSFAATYTFRRTGTHRVVFLAGEHRHELTIDVERSSRQEVASDDGPVTTQHRFVTPRPSPTPSPTPAGDDGIDWSLPGAMSGTMTGSMDSMGAMGETPAPWTGDVI